MGSKTQMSGLDAVSHRRWRRRLRAELVFFLRAMRVLVLPIAALLLLALLGTLTLRFLGAPPGGLDPTWSQAFFMSYSLFFLEFVAPLPSHGGGQMVFFIQPLLGVLLLGDGLLRLASTVLKKQQNQEVWLSILAESTRNHIILCGLGTVGFRVLQELHRLGHEVFAIERNKDNPFIERAQKLDGVHIYMGDARAENILKALHVDTARAVIIATDDDLANLEIAMDARELSQKAHIVMRLWDQRLATKVQSVLGVEVSVSTSKLAAPLFASAALDPSIVGVHRVGETLAVVMDLDVTPGSTLDGSTPLELLAGHQVSIVAVHTPEGVWRTPAPPETPLAAGDTIHVMVPSARVDEVHALNGGKA